MIMCLIECVDREGIRNNFKYILAKDENSEDRIEWKFSVIPEDEKFADFFYLTAEEINDETLKITMINHHNQDIYIAKGIPEKIIQELSILSEMKVISSSNKSQYQSFESEFRTPSATKVWERIRNFGNATYDSEQDIYSYKI